MSRPPNAGNEPWQNPHQPYTQEASDWEKELRDRKNEEWRKNNQPPEVKTNSPTVPYYAPTGLRASGRSGSGPGAALVLFAVIALLWWQGRQADTPRPSETPGPQTVPVEQGAPPSIGNAVANPLATPAPSDPAVAAPAVPADAAPPAVGETRPPVVTGAAAGSLALNVTHKHRGRDCEGVLTFTATGIRYVSDQPKDSFAFARGQVQLDKDGFKDPSGKSWHFEAGGRDMERTFLRWKAGTLELRGNSRP